MNHLEPLKQRISDIESSGVGISVRGVFIDFIKTSDSNKDSVALSISVGDGFWDYLVFTNTAGTVKKIIATDVVDNPVNKEDEQLLKSLGDWEFKKVEAEKSLPFENEYFDLIYHMDVIEHVKKPHLFLSEQYRVLKEGGALLIGTPNIFRPVNVFKLLLGKLFFPIKLGSNQEIGDYVHMQEFNEFQLKNMLEEIGFKEIEIKHCYFGIWPLRITFSLYPKSKIGKGMCHYLMVKCRK